MNPRPLGYEPNELPDCSTPRHARAATLSGLTQRCETPNCSTRARNRQTPLQQKTAQRTRGYSDHGRSQCAPWAARGRPTELTSEVRPSEAVRTSTRTNATAQRRSLINRLTLQRAHNTQRHDQHQHHHRPCRRCHRHRRVRQHRNQVAHPVLRSDPLAHSKARPPPAGDIRSRPHRQEKPCTPSLRTHSRRRLSSRGG